MELITELWRRVAKGRGGVKSVPTCSYRSRPASYQDRRPRRSQAVNVTAMDRETRMGNTIQSCQEMRQEKKSTFLSDHDPLEKESRTSSDTKAERSGPMTLSTVLVVDDEESIRDLIRSKLTQEGRHVLLAARGQEAIEVFRRHRPHITILDLHMPEMNGIEVLRQIRAVDPQAVVMIFTGAETEALARQARELGVTEFIQKGLSLPPV